jgi:hypothetical protein
MDELKDHRLASNFTAHLENIPESFDFETEDGENTVDASVMGVTSIKEHSVLFNLFIDKFVLQLNPSFSMKKIDKGTGKLWIHHLVFLS